MIPKYKIGDIVVVQDRRYQRTYEVGKKEPVSYVQNFKWQGVVTDVRIDITAFNPWIGTWNYPMLISYPVYYLVKEGNYHSTRVDEEEQMFGGAFLFPSKPKKLI